MPPDSLLGRSALAAALLLAAAGLPAQRPDGLYAEIHTSKGRIVARLAPEFTPLAVANFVGLAEGTIENAAFEPGRPFYDGTVYHRVVPGHVIQTGAARGGRAAGPGYTFPNEIHARLSHDHAGALNMANGGPHTNASQFCITLGDRSYLDGDYIVFGEVVDGMETVRSIVQGDVVDSVRIARVGEQAHAYRVTSESFRALVQAAGRRMTEHAEKQRSAEREWIARNLPNDPGPGDAVRTVRRTAGTSEQGSGPLRVRYRGTSLRYLGHVLEHTGPPLRVATFASTPDGTPGPDLPPATFTFQPGTTRINSGLDRTIAEMTPGERRVIILPAEAGYGRSGFYAREIPGQRRFVISPNTLLVYEVEILPPQVTSAKSTRATRNRMASARGNSVRPTEKIRP
jgi:cyclophilin family peptidyl-prolyl cis-trans isomerase